jgi:hypothetical protein
MRQRDPELAKGWVQFVPTLWVDTTGGRQKMNCATGEKVVSSENYLPEKKNRQLNKGKKK